MPIVDRIQELCKMRDVNIKILQNELGFSNAAIYRWDENSPSYDKLQKVADYFNVSVDHLIYGYNRSLFSLTLSLLKGERSEEQFAKDLNMDIDDLLNYLGGKAEQKPSIEMLEKLVKTNFHAPFISAGEIYKDAGYEVPEQYKNQSPPAPPTQQLNNEQNEQEQEILRIFKTLNIKDRTALLSYAYELEERNK